MAVQIDIAFIVSAVQLLALLGGGFYFLAKIESKIDTRLIKLNTLQEGFKEELESIKIKLDALSKVTIEIARQDERMTAQDLRITQLAVRVDDHLSKARDRDHQIARQRK